MKELFVIVCAVLILIMIPFWVYYLYQISTILIYYQAVTPELLSHLGWLLRTVLGIGICGMLMILVGK